MSGLAVLSDGEWRNAAGLFFGSIHRTVKHLRVTDTIWHSRFALVQSPPEHFDAELGYSRFNAEKVRIPFAPALGHFFNHATHHRGQVPAAVTALGYPGPSLDWVALIQSESRTIP